MAHKKGQGSVKNGRDSNSKRLGVKKYGGEAVIPGNILIRQRGRRTTHFCPGIRGHCAISITPCSVKNSGIRWQGN